MDAAIALGQAIPQPANVDFLARDRLVSGGLRQNGELFLPLSTIAELGWSCAISGSDALVYVQKDPVRIGAKTFNHKLYVPLRALIEQSGGVAEWNADGTIMAVRGVIKRVEAENGRIFVDATIGGRVDISTTEKPRRAVFSFVGLRLNAATQIELSPGARAAQFDSDHVRIVVETDFGPKTETQQLEANWTLRWSSKAEPAIPLSFEAFAPFLLSPPATSFDDLPLMLAPGVDVTRRTLVDTPRLVSENNQSALIGFSMTAPLTQPVRYARPAADVLEITLPGAKMRVLADLNCSFVRGVTQEDTAEGMVLTFKLSRPLGLEISQRDRSLQLLLLVPKEQDGHIAGKVIVVDAGHGGPDNGARDPGKTTNEKDLNLAIAQQLATKLAEQGATVIMTRKTDVLIPLRERAEIANRNRADLFISIHINSNKAANTTSGTIMFFHGQNAISNLLADCLRVETGKLGRLRSIGSWSDTRIYDTGFAVLRYSSMPGVLVETGFINHSKDLAVMRSIDFQRDFAAALVRGIKVFLAMATNSKPGRNAWLLVLMALSGAVFGGLIAYVKLGGEKVPTDIRRDAGPPPSSRSSRTSDPSNTNSGQSIDVFIPTASGEDVGFRSERRILATGEDPMVAAVNGFLSAAKITDPDARLLSVDLHDHIADLYFNAKFNQTLGSLDEGTVLKGLRMSFRQFSDVQRLRLFADGQPIETLGSVELAEGIKVED